MRKEESVYDMKAGREGKQRNRKKIVPAYMELPIIFTLLMNTAAYYGTRLLVGNSRHYDLTGALEKDIPLIPATIVIYLGCYAYWVVNYILGCRQKRREAYRLYCADLIAKLVCLIIFLVFPTTNTRPELVGTDFFTDAMRFLYAADAADNLFPSIHCLTSWFCYIAVRNNRHVPKTYKIVSFVLTAAVCVSTLTTKQHVLIDVVGGIALAEGCYWLVGKMELDRWYGKAVVRIGKKLSVQN